MIPDEIRAMCKHKLLSKSAEKILARKIKLGGPEGKRAKDRLVEHNLRLALSNATWFSTHSGGGNEISDLFQAAVVGLITAAEKFDPDRGFAFSTMATFWIRQALQRHVAFTANTIRLPDATSKIRLTAFHNPDLSLDELAEKMQHTRSKTLSALRAATVVQSLDAPVGDTEMSVHEWCPDEHVDAEFAEIADDHEWVRNLLAELPADQRQVLELRFGFGNSDALTVKEIAVELDLTDDEVGRLNRDGLRELRAMTAAT